MARSPEGSFEGGSTPVNGSSEDRSGPRRSRDVVRFEGVAKTYAGVTAVADLTLTVKSGEFLTILGPSGSGKTTLLMMLAGFIRPTRGEIFLDDRPVSALPAQKRNLGVVYQNYALFPHLSVADNVGFPLAMRRVPRKEREKRVTAALELVGLEGMADRKPRQLSGGQQQRVALARATVFEPQVLLMDEPLGALDRNMRLRMQAELKAFQRRLNVVVFYVTHDQEEAITMSDRIVTMRDGRIEQIGTPTDLYERPATEFVAGFLGNTNFIRKSVVVGIDGDYCRVRQDSGFVFEAPTRPGMKPEDAALVAIRPERFSILPADEPATRSNVCPGRVLSVHYGGDSVSYRVDVPDLQTIVEIKELVTGASSAFQAEDAVRIQWERSVGHLLAEDSA